MERSGIAAAIVSALAAGGCYSPSVDSCVYACNNGACPDGLVCTTENLCAETVDTSCTAAGFPQTQLDGKPAALTNTASATFAFSAPGSSDAHFECALDDGAFDACNSPRVYDGVADGDHMFRVRAVTSSGLADQSPASYAWTIDTIAPETTFVMKPSDPSRASPSFGIESSEPGSTFECKLDGASAFTSCSATMMLQTLGDGAHTFAARATDAAGNVDQTPVTFGWTVDGTAPTVTFTGATPTMGSTSGPRVTVQWSKNETSTDTCTLDGQPFACATNPLTASFANGAHTFAVNASDAVGNVGTASVTWTVDCASALTGTGRFGLFHFDEASGQTVVNASTGGPAVLGDNNSETALDPMRVAPGRLGSGALAFTTPTSRVTWPTTMSTTADLTLSTFFKPTGASATGLDIISTPDGHVHLGQDANTSQVTLTLAITDTVGNPHLVSTNVLPNVWHQLFATYEHTTGTLTLIVDGGTPKVNTATAAPFDISTIYFGSGQFGEIFSTAGGVIDEPFVSTSALPITEATRQYCPN